MNSMLHASFNLDSIKKDDSTLFWKDLKSADNFDEVRPSTRKGRHEEVWLVQRSNRTAYFVDPKTEFSGVCTFCFKMCSWNRIMQHIEEHQLAIHPAGGNPKKQCPHFPPVVMDHDKLKKKDNSNDDSFADKLPPKKKKREMKAKTIFS
jgi:hypothetical protein